MKMNLPMMSVSFSKSDPSSPGMSDLITTEEQEWSVEDVAQMEAADVPALEALAEEPVEQTEAEVAAEDVTSEARARRIPRPMRPRVPLPIFPIKRLVSGRYRSCLRYWQLVLRVDVDGKRPMKRLSGDFYQISGSTVTYFGSFVVKWPTVKVTSTQVIIQGMGTYTWSAGAPKIRVIIPRHTIFMPPAAAHVQFMTTSNRPGAAYICLFESRYFRSVRYEQDYVKGVTPFTSYNTGSLPSGGPARTLTVAKAYAEAGVEMQATGAWNEVPIAGAGPGAKWSNAELHQAMEKQFSLWKDVPRWAAWLLAAQLHQYGPGLYGIMFDQKGKQRQGCAVFHAGIGGSTAVKLRDQLYTYVHELGHCFNLFHPFHKKYMTPPMPNRPKALSWMHYPRYYTGGAGGTAAFWNAFPFQFDNLEVIHLRHAFRNNVIMGGNPFGIGAALEDPQAFADPVENNSGLRLELGAPKSLAFGEPVVVEIKLQTTDMRGKTAHNQSQLHPNMGFVQVAIQKPSGQVMVYEPMMEHCVEAETTTLDTDNPSIYASAYIGYGKDGFYFDQTGFYKIRAIYYALDGSTVLSDVLTLRVRTPLDSTEEEVADLFFGDDQGKLLYLLGSDSEFLESGNKAFDEMLDKHGDHPMAVYAKLVKGTNAGRQFKSFTSDREFAARKPDQGKSIELLSDVVDASEGEAGVDNITLNMTMCSLARAQKSTGDEEGAKTTMGRMVDIFTKKSFKAQVMKLIKAQAKAALKEE